MNICMCVCTLVLQPGWVIRTIQVIFGLLFIHVKYSDRIFFCGECFKIRMLAPITLMISMTAAQDALTVQLEYLIIILIGQKTSHN